LLAGAVASQAIEVQFIGDESLSKRPMGRVAVPLGKMGADVETTEEETLPMRVRGGGLTGINYESPISSAQVKSSVLLAALNARGVTEYREPIRSRDHTERMLKAFGAGIATNAMGGGRGGYEVQLEPGATLSGRDTDVPSDFSSAMFLIVAAVLLPRSDVIIEDVGLNPGRREALNVLTRMGANIEITDRCTVGGEQRGNIRVRHSKLKGTGVTGNSIPWIIDEIPILAVAGAFAEGETYFKNAEELRQKESDRIESVLHNLQVLGVENGEYPDGFILRGKRSHDGGSFESFGDHRIALAFHVAALACHGESTIQGYSAAEVSWPGFDQVIESLRIQ
jgi:3-phosphoshikimate 1-carboxyvinyltransferase